MLSGLGNSYPLYERNTEMKTLLVEIENCLEQEGIMFRRTDLPGVLSTECEMAGIGFPSSVEIDEAQRTIQIRT